MSESDKKGWADIRLDAIIDFNPREKLPKAVDAPYIEMAALPVDSRWHDVPVVRASSSGSRFRDGDTLLARITPCLENGKTAQVRGLGPGVIGWGSTEFIVMRAKDGLADPGFVYAIARDPNFREYAIQQMTGTSGRQRVPVETVESFEIAVPAIEEQRRISGVLGILDARIDVARRLQVSLASVAAAITEGIDSECVLGDLALAVRT
jgi:type I restriction enzyme S subunit